MQRIQEDFKLKDNKIAEPDVYLGAPIAKMSLNNGETCWIMSPEQYVKTAVTNVEEDLTKHRKRLPSKCVTPFSCNYAPWLKETPGRKADGVQRFQELIGQLWWAVEIGRVDILLKTLLLSSYLTMPRAGHLEQALHIFGYLKTHPKRKIGFDPSHPEINENRKSDPREQTRTSRQKHVDALFCRCQSFRGHGDKTITNRYPFVL
jgi:hypothetical protein